MDLASPMLLHAFCHSMWSHHINAAVWCFHVSNVRKYCPVVALAHSKTYSLLSASIVFMATHVVVPTFVLEKLKTLTINRWYDNVGMLRTYCVLVDNFQGGYRGFVAGRARPTLTASSMRVFFCRHV